MKPPRHSPSTDATTDGHRAAPCASQTSPSQNGHSRKRRGRRKIASQITRSRKSSLTKSHSNIEQRQAQVENNTRSDDHTHRTQSENDSHPQQDETLTSVEPLEVFLSEGECLGGRGPPYPIEPPLFLVFSGKDSRYSDEETSGAFNTMKQVNACVSGCSHYIWTEYKSVDRAWDSWEKGCLEKTLPLPIHPESLWPMVVPQKELERRREEYLLSVGEESSSARSSNSLSSFLERYGLEARLPLLPGPLTIPTPTHGWYSQQDAEDDPRAAA
ncbi:hypothetical protein NM688_g2115 [Phlebia brevispora]|uniref:Uncharacterized protein n=1 Tax=Phlebia brevispora TaxID=194682 RepID=A0ACC1T9L4_9APHY|nr:hypothetical protein NM688_g2115 [Phlebia brevispora]